MQGAFTVSAITAYIQELFKSDEILCDIWVQGEVTNFSRSSSGHCYFSLCDERSQIKCVLFSSTAKYLLFLPENGDAVVVHGAIRIYEQAGRYQLYVDTIQPLGDGVLLAQFRQLYAKLEQEGLFAATRKRPLPSRPRYIGVVTSPSGAVWHDIQTILRRRYPLAHLILAPALVQGEEAPATVIAALEALQRDGRAELIIIARGGGSFEDLWCFNDERLVRAVFACNIPVVSAIGHETDYTLCDFVADLRAPTPSAAAEQVTPDIRDLRRELLSFAQRAGEASEMFLARHRASLTTLRARLDQASPRRTVDDTRIQLDEASNRMGKALQMQIQRARSQLGRLQRELDLLHPWHPIERGYSVVLDATTGHWLRSHAELADPQAVQVVFADGTAYGTIRPAYEVQGGQHG